MCIRDRSHTVPSVHLLHHGATSIFDVLSEEKNSLSSLFFISFYTTQEGPNSLHYFNQSSFELQTMNNPSTNKRVTRQDLKKKSKDDAGDQVRIKRKTKAKKVKNEVKLRVPPLSNPKKSFGEILLKQNSCEVAFDFIFISLGQMISQGSFFI